MLDGSWSCSRLPAQCCPTSMPAKHPRPPCLRHPPTHPTYTPMQMSQLTTDNSSADELRETIKALDDQINGIKASEEKLRAQLVELRAKEQEEGSDVPAMIQERDECR